VYGRSRGVVLGVVLGVEEKEDLMPRRRIF